MSAPNDPSLPFEVRQQLLIIASDLIGRRPQAELPVAVRRFARFTPAKRLRLGGAEIAAALAADDGFRGDVGDLVREASPELVEQIMAGKPPATADPVDIAVVAYLLRPARWQEVVTSAVGQLADQADQRVADDETDRQRQELNRVRTQQAELTRARDMARSALRAAESAHEREIAELNHRIRTIQGDLRQAIRRAEEAERALETGDVDHQRALAAAAADARKARSRVADLEQLVSSGRANLRSERSRDDARLWILLEQLSAATSGLRRELDLTVPTATPADTVSGAQPATPSRPATVDTSLLSRMLDGRHVHLIVDGYNITKTGYPELTLADQRSRLVAGLGSLTAQTGVEITVAFDGTAAPVGVAARSSSPRGVRVLFSRPGDLADDLIRQLLRAEPSGRAVLVASSDEAVAASARASNAWPVPATVLLDRLGKMS